MPRAGRTPSKSVTAQSIMGKHAARREGPGKARTARTTSGRSMMRAAVAWHEPTHAPWPVGTNRA
jgi:hypothetical protein